VRCSPRALWLQAYHEARRSREDRWFTRVNASLSRLAADVAAKSSADLLLYAEYAREAFSDRRLSGRLKGLFVFHPHARLAKEILRQDAARFPECSGSLRYASETENRELVARVDAELAMADFFLCASSFTRQSLLSHGVCPERIAVVPYGAPSVQGLANTPRDTSATRFLYVGQGVQRKGLHHLLRAWSQSRLSNASLRVICPRLEPGFQPLVNQPNVEFSAAVSRAELLEAFTSSHVFVMPSLVEGFGLVYLEALAAGCLVIATPHTGVPDLGLPEGMALLVEPGDIGQLCEALQQAHQRRAAHLIDHEAIAAVAATLTWEGFRQRLLWQLGALTSLRPAVTADARKPPN
jgi:glycosyltransferase involved in cell wall biosynthesis